MIACVGVLVAIPIVFMIAAAILRLSVSFANVFIKTEPPRHSLDVYPDYGDYEEFKRGRRSRSESGGGIPVPSTGQAIVIILVTGLINLVLSFGAGLAIGASGVLDKMDRQQAELVFQLASLPIGFLTSSLVLAGLLPTSFWRGCLVTICQYVIVFAIVAVIAAAVLGIIGLQKGVGG